MQLNNAVCLDGVFNPSYLHILSTVRYLTIMSHSHNENAHAHYAEANRATFDKFATEYEDQPMALPLTNLIGPHLLSAYPFNKESTTVLDYACGTGLMSRRLALDVKSILGVDISQGMVDQYNKRADGGETKAVCVELKGESGELEDRKFNVIIVRSSCTSSLNLLKPSSSVPSRIITSAISTS